MSCSLNPIITSISGDCSNTNSGGFSLEIYGTAPDYSINWINPPSGTTALGAGVTAYTINNLSAGTYTFEIIDSCSPENTVKGKNVFISSGTCASIVGLQNTTCNLDNGSLTAQTQNFYGPSSIFRLYDFDTDTLITTATTFTGTLTFNNLSAGTYYVICDDGGGCTGRTESCIVKTSTTFNYDLYVVNDAGCSLSGAGAVYVTNLNGGPPYTYTWSTGSNSSYISGLTAGPYNVTIVDSSGCELTKYTAVVDVPPVALATYSLVAPTCGANDGEITIQVSGGTAPYYFLGSNGDSTITFSSSYTFTGLGPGPFTVQVTDAGLCTFSTIIDLTSPGSFSITSIDVINSTCTNTDGSIDINLFGVTSAFIEYTLVNSTGGTSVYYQTPAGGGWTFNNLKSDTYTITISGSNCSYTTTVVVSNVPFLDLTYNITGTTCNSCNGDIELSISGQSAPYTFTLNGLDVVYNNSVPNYGASSYTFTNLCSGTYVGTVQKDSCTISQNIIIPTSPTVQFSLFSTDPSAYSNNGSISAFITNGTPPFTLTWSSNVNGQTGLTVNNLSAGTYTLTVEDSIGCIRTRYVTLIGYVPIISYQTYNICDSDFENSGLLLTKNITKMLNEGFVDLTSGDTNCILNEAIFTTVTNVGGEIKTDVFYTGTSLTDVPTDQQFANSIENLLLSYPQITGVTIDIVSNNVKLTTKCNTLSGVEVTVSLIISYDISCEELAPGPCVYKQWQVNFLDSCETTTSDCNGQYTTTLLPSGVNVICSVTEPSFTKCSIVTPVSEVGICVT
jgi:hypothetical protein